MRKKRIRLTAGMLFLSLALSGCESIILDADVNKATVATYTVPLSTVSESIAVETDLELTEEKYAIQGTDAFYILPAHRPGPKNIVDFQILDFINGTTMIYAYQALDASGDSSGLGGAPEQGTAQDADNNAGEAITDTETMATVLMAYQVNTRQYRVLFHQTSPYDKTAVPEWDETSSSTDTFAAAGENGTGQQSETGSFFAQKIGEESGRYFFYFDGVGRVYSDSGQLIYEKSIQDVLDYNVSRYGGEGAAVTISNVVMDTNYFLYVTLNIEKEGAQIDESTETGDLEDEDSDVVQMLYYCFTYDIGEPEGAAEGEERYFLSRNTNYEEQTESWEAANQQTYDLGLLDGEPDAEDAALLVQEADGTLMTEAMIKARHPDEFEIYHYYDPQFQLQLYYFIPYEQYWLWFWIDGWYMELNNGIWQKYFGAPELSPLVPAVMDEEYYGRYYGQRCFVAGIPDAQGNLKVYFLDQQKQPEPQTANLEEKTRSYTLVWEEEVTTEATEDEPASVARQTFEKTITEKAVFTESYETRFKGEVFVSWSEDIYTADMIAASPGSGVLRYGSEEKDWAELEEQTTFLRWMLSTQGDFSAGGIPGASQNAVLCRESQGDEGRPYLFAVTSSGLTIFPGDSGNRTGWGPSSFGESKLYIPYSQINFGVSMDSGGMAEINQVVLDDGVDQELTASPTTGSDEYDANTLLVRQEGGRYFLYLAGVDNGLVKYNLSASEEAAGRCGQLSPYPYYAIWEGEEGSNCLYGVGFQSGDYAYSESDVSCAKVYRIPLYDEEAAANLSVSALNMDSQLRRQVLQGGSGAQSTWDAMIANLGLTGADLSQVELYREFLLEGKTQREKALLEFYQLASIPVKDRTEALREQAAACLYPEDLEEIIVSVKGKGEDPQTVIRAEMERAGLTSDQWGERLKELVFLMQIPETMEEFLQKKAVILFAQMAQTVPETALKSRLAGCFTAADLEEELARYYLDSETIFLLAGAGENTDPETLAKAREKQEKALEECREGYMENGYQETESGKVYWKTVYGTVWNAKWEQLWSSSLKQILDAFHPEKEE